MIKNIGWTLGNDCPCKCKHCYSFSVRQKRQNLTKEIVDRVIEQIEKLNVETVNLGGNEPIFTNVLDVKKSMLPYILKELLKNYPEMDSFYITVSMEERIKRFHERSKSGNEVTGSDKLIMDVDKFEKIY